MYKIDLILDSLYLVLINFTFRLRQKLDSLKNIFFFIFISLNYCYFWNIILNYKYIKNYILKIVNLIC